MKRYADILQTLKEEGRLRSLQTTDAPSSLIDLSSNDYLGLAADPCFAQEFLRLNKSPLFSSAASRLLCSHQKSYTALEDLLNNLYGKRTLLFNSGYHANTGIVSALAIPGTIIIEDKLVHASIIDGLRLSKAPFTRFRHNDVPALRAALNKYHTEYERMIVIVESIYSMDGDIAPLSEIAALKEEYPGMMLYVDEAHALGVRGEYGLGVCEEYGILDKVDLLVGTFGKACASAGAFVATSEEIREFLVNTARSFIFSTALPPVNIEFTRFMMEKIVDMKAEREMLRQISTEFREALSAITGTASSSESQIVPLLIGSNQGVVSLSQALREKDILALPIRRPTVAAGTERIRFSLNATLSSPQIEYVIHQIEQTLCSSDL